MSGRERLAEALARAFERGGAPSTQEARQMAEQYIDDPAMLGELGRAMILVSLDQSDSATWRHIGQGFLTITERLGEHGLAQRQS